MLSTEINSDIDALWVEVESLRAKNKHLQEQVSRLSKTLYEMQQLKPRTPTWKSWEVWCSADGRIGATSCEL